MSCPLRFESQYQLIAKGPFKRARIVIASLPDAYNSNKNNS